MKVILLKDVAKLGKRFDVKEVNSGHALNFLIPRGLAVTGTAEALKKVELDKAKEIGERKVNEDLLLKNLSKLEQTSLKVIGKANAKGHLFAGLHREDVASEISKQAHLNIDPMSIMLDHPIKVVGEHEIEVAGAGKTIKIKLVIEGK